jgi:sterol desaturase/sphingolipid hydroxylase (fatty acid hydroxylase superfamily)
MFDFFYIGLKNYSILFLMDHEIGSKPIMLHMNVLQSTTIETIMYVGLKQQCIDQSWFYCILFELLYDFFYYGMHRFAHRYFYKYHKKHHHFVKTHAITTFYQDPLDCILTHVPMVLTMYVCPISLFQWNVLLLYQKYVEIHEHDGDIHHSLHHSRLFCNYGRYTFWDKMFKTYRALEQAP